MLCIVDFKITMYIDLKLLLQKLGLPNNYFSALFRYKGNNLMLYYIRKHWKVLRIFLWIGFCAALSVLLILFDAIYNKVRR